MKSPQGQQLSNLKVLLLWFCEHNDLLPTPAASADGSHKECCRASWDPCECEGTLFLGAGPWLLEKALEIRRLYVAAMASAYYTHILNISISIYIYSVYIYIVCVCIHIYIYIY